MFKSLGTALIASVLAVAMNGVAQAGTHTHPGLSLGTLPATVNAQSTSGLMAGSTDATPAREFAIPASARRQLMALENDGNMSPNADEQMWSGGRTSARHSDPINRFARGIISRTSSIAISLTRSAMRFIGTPYVFGGTSPSGFDCSGYVQHVFAMLGIALPRTADAQYYAGRPAIGGLHMGDLVFFQTYLPGPSHVGIYLSNGKFIASSGHGVMVSRLSDRYWAARYIGAKRVLALR